MWELDHKEGWAPKNWCFRIIVLEKTLERVPWTARGSNQWILKEINPEYSLEGLMLKLKLQYFGHLMWSADSLGKTLMLGEIEGRSRRVWQRMKSLDGITDSMDMRLSKLQGWWRTGKPAVLQSMGSQSRTQLSDWKQQQQILPGRHLWTNIIYSSYLTRHFPSNPILLCNRSSELFHV